MTAPFFYPTLWCGAVRPDMPVRQYLLPASSWGRFIRKDGTIRPANLPSAITRCAVDPGAYDAARRGRYQYDFLQYLRWLFSFQKGQVEWAGMPDYCCAYCLDRPPTEEEQRAWFFRLADGDPVRMRQVLTTFTAQMIWLNHREVPFIWVPTLHGLTVDQYARHARDMRDLILTMNWWYGPRSAFRVGIGSLCRSLQPGELHAIIDAVSYELPGISFHLFGIKLKTFQTMRYNLPACVRSCDSTLWSGLRTLVANPELSCDPSGTSDTSDYGLIDPFVKAWKLSGKSEMDYAYSQGLPGYEKAIKEALSKIRPSLLPFEGPPGYPRWDDMPDELNHLLAEQRKALDAIPYPEGYQWHFEHSNANDWFWP
ncbi:MAG TPA: hypothetical protein VFV38_25545 [Ktedonobacteraceae bacterium]|nr:hypothetical protein [Ktedonobacteraceae bacterium]